MEDANPKTKVTAQGCQVEGCPGELQKRHIAHTLRHQGRLMVIEGVPAEVCDFCDMELLSPETTRHIDNLLGESDSREPDGSVPLYLFARFQS